jgi:hypothetical protein
MPLFIALVIVLALDATPFKSVAHLADSLLVEIRRWSNADTGRPQDDDITLLVLQVE